MSENSNLRIAVDIGGTFTDVAITEPDGAICATAKTPTTPQDPTRGALTGVRRALDQLGAGLDQATGFIHGTTLATNALIERRGAVVSTVTTEGFRDILEIAYERRYDQYDIDLDKPDLIVPRARSFTIPERMTVAGAILQSLDESAVDGLIADLDAAGTEAVAICLLHAYADPRHEQRLRDLIAARRPDLAISLSSEVSPEAREFDRLCTTVANAYIQPLMARYLARFAEVFAAEGLGCPVLMMTSGGGMTTIETARRLPIRLVESGPSGGAVLAAQVARGAGLDRVLSFDVGGTTAKLCLIDDFTPQSSRTFEIARAARFIKGSGMPVRIPVIEMIEIGAGGGSIASVDSLGRIRVGPRSAGSEPGPAAFGRGGAEATVTDADATLGYLDPARFAEGRLAIDLEAAAEALTRSVGEPLSLTPDGAARGVCEIVDESMASAGRMHAVESGKDLGDRVMIAFGGNGPLHATRVARRAGVRRIVIPPNPGVGSAVGFLDAPVSFELVRSRYATLESFDVDALNTLFDEMEAQARAVVRAGAPDAPIAVRRTAFMRYRGQGHEVEIPLPDRALEPGDAARLRAAFETAYAALFSRAVPGMTIEALNWSVVASTPARGIAPRPEDAPENRPVPEASRPILCDVSAERVAAAVYDRASLSPGDRLSGPALIVEPQSTTLVSADFDARVDAVGNLLLERRETVR